MAMGMSSSRFRTSMPQVRKGKGFSETCFARVDKLVTGKDSNRTQAQCPMLLVWSVNVHTSVGKVQSDRKLETVNTQLISTCIGWPTRQNNARGNQRVKSTGQVPPESAAKHDTCIQCVGLEGERRKMASKVKQRSHCKKQASSRVAKFACHVTKDTRKFFAPLELIPF